MEIIELFPGCAISYALYRRVRLLLALLCVCAGLYRLDRVTGFGRADLERGLPLELTVTRPLVTDGHRDVEAEATYQVAYLDRFLRGRTQAPDLVRYAATVAPAAMRLARITVIGEDTITGQAHGGPTLRIEGRAPDADRLRAFVSSLRVMAPAVCTEQLPQPASDLEGGVAFRVSTDPDQRPLAAPGE